jgi:hypothetical protein
MYLFPHDFTRLANRREERPPNVVRSATSKMRRFGLERRLKNIDVSYPGAPLWRHADSETRPMPCDLLFKVTVRLK